MSGPLTLVFETSTPRASLALIDGDGGTELREFASDRHHNAALFGPLQELLRGLSPERIGLVLVGSGPGSYSGTRVGIAAAQGVAIAAGCPAVAVPSILAVPSAAGGASCLAVGDARRGSFWTAEISNSGLFAEPALTDAAGFEAAVRKAVSDGRTVITFEEPAKLPLGETFIRREYPDAARLHQAWLSADGEIRQTWLSAPPQPMYLKPPHITPAKRSWLVTPQP